MCKIFKTRFTQCSHSEKQLIRCQASVDNGDKKVEGKKKKCWLRCLFSSFSRKKDGCDYITINLRSKVACGSCSTQMTGANQEDREDQTVDVDDADDTDPTDENSRQAYIKYQAEQRANIDEQTKRFHFQCSTCSSEGRNLLPEERNPAINKGLCCARGVDQYHTLYRTLDGDRDHGMHRVPQDGHPRITDNAAVTPHSPREGSGTQLHNSTKRKPKKLTKRNKNPSEGYKKDEDPNESAEIKPGLPMDHLSAPTRRLSPLNQPERPTSPMKNKPGIMWDRWTQMVQTHHGRYPPPESPPDKAVPPVTIADKGKQIQRSASGRDSTADLFQRPNCRSIPQLDVIRASPFRISTFKENRQSLEIAVPYSDPPYRPGSQILVPLFPAPRSTATSSDTPAQSLKSVASKLEDAIDGAMEVWRK